MLKLNIIPNEYKKEIKISNINFFLKNLFAILTIFLSIYAVTILVFNLILSAHFVKTINDTTLVTKKTENKSNEVRSINSLINDMEKIQDDSVNWSYLLSFINKNVADDIKLTRITASKETNKLILNGLSQTRDSLLQLKEALENSKLFSSIDFPIKNLLQKNDINFEINAEFDNYEFN